MTVKELKKLLETVDDDKIVILQRDSEGNGYSPCAGADSNCAYIPESTWSGEVGVEELTTELKARGFTIDDVSEGESALLLYPIN